MQTTIAPRPDRHQLLAFGALLGRSGKFVESAISGTSMGGILPSGCRIRILPLTAPEYKVGQVVAFVTGEGLFAHRIVDLSRQGVLTRGDAHTLCDSPIPFDAILGTVMEYFVDGKWLRFEDGIQSCRETCTRTKITQILLCVCMRIDIRFAWHASRILRWLARWHHRLRKLAKPDSFAQ